MESVVTPVMGRVSADCNVLSRASKGGVHLEYYGSPLDPLFPDPEEKMRLKIRKLTEDGYRVIDSQVHFDPHDSLRFWGWVIYTEGE